MDATTAPRSFVALVAVARRRAGMTAAEFDHSLAFPAGTDGRALAAFGNAAYQLATEGLPAITPGTGSAELRRRHEAANALLEQYRADIDAMVAAAKGKSYEGWSRYSGGPIRYASE